MWCREAMRRAWVAIGACVWVATCVCGVARADGTAWDSLSQEQQTLGALERRRALPLQQPLRGPLVVAILRRRPEHLERQLERFRAEDSLVFAVNALKLRGLLVAGEREISLARNPFHERFAFRAQPLQRQSPHGVNLSAR